jgi:hypothetical protein
MTSTNYDFYETTPTKSVETTSLFSTILLPKQQIKNAAKENKFRMQ